MQILINSRLNSEHLERIRSGFPELEVVQTEDNSEAAKLIERTDILVTWWSNFSAGLLASSPQLKWVHSLAAGVDGFFLPPITQGRVLLTNSSGIHGIPMAEHVLGMMLAISRGLQAYALQQSKRRWERLSLTELYGKTLGIVGLGSIGQEIALRAEAFGMQVLGVKRSPSQVPGVNRVVTMEGLDMVLKESDYIVLAVPLTPETRQLIGPRELELMKPTAVLINVARGEVVDEAALIAALRQKRIAAAALDVFETEPLPADSPLWELDNCLITPHCAALSPQYMSRAIDLFCRNLEAYLSGKPLPNLVDPVRGY